MPPPHQQSRANLGELRAVVVKRIGLERSELYFHYVNRFLSLKLGKAEFDKLCLKVLGKENLRLHNQLIRAILRNACCGKAPPVSPVPNGSKSLTNGDVLHLSSPRTSLGIPRHPNGIVNVSSSRPADEDDTVIYENGTLGVHDLAAKGVSLSSRSQSRLQNYGDGALGRSQMKAMLGLPFCPVSSVDRARKTFLGGIYYQCSGSMGLLDSQTLRDRMQHFASDQGLKAVSMEGANLLNKGLDAYLIRLIRSCFELMGAKRRDGLMIDGLHSHLSNQGTQLQNNGGPFDYTKADRSPFQATLSDFKVAMELNPQHLGENSPLQLEKLCSSSFDWQSN